jgi:hypothetical protein
MYMCTHIRRYINVYLYESEEGRGDVIGGFIDGIHSGDFLYLCIYIYKCTHIDVYIYIFMHIYIHI